MNLLVLMARAAEAEDSATDLTLLFDETVLLLLSEFIVGPLLFRFHRQSSTRSGNATVSGSER